jgi:hypothetical protein
MTEAEKIQAKIDYFRHDIYKDIQTVLIYLTLLNAPRTSKMLRTMTPDCLLEESKEKTVTTFVDPANPTTMASKTCQSCIHASRIGSTTEPKIPCKIYHKGPF